jgi:hypothetical protein
MKWWSVAVALLWLLACRDPNSYQPFDPTKPNPPAPPVLSYPVNGWVSDGYGYPQDVNFGWQRLAGAQFYQIEVYRDSLLRSQYLVYAADRVTLTAVTDSIPNWGMYYWHVRAASRYWNNYTDWSDPFHFALPNPAKQSGGRDPLDSGTRDLADHAGN